MSSQESTPTPRVQVRCAGIDAPESTLLQVRQAAERLLGSSCQVELAVVRLARARPERYRCDTQLFDRELAHVAGHAEGPDPVETAKHSVERALRALHTSDCFNPWTSPHPGSQRGGALVK